MPIKQAVPFFWVRDISKSARYYVDGLGFKITRKWIDQGALRWGWLDRDGASLMLQEFAKSGNHASPPPEKLGEGVSLCFVCDDAIAIFRELSARGIHASRPVVGNGMWVTELVDPDGYKLAFESETDAPEESKFLD